MKQGLVGIAVPWSLHFILATCASINDYIYQEADMGLLDDRMYSGLLTATFQPTLTQKGK